MKNVNVVGKTVPDIEFVQLKKQNGSLVLNGKDFKLILPISLPILYPRTEPTLKYPTLIVKNPIHILSNTLQHCYNNSRKTLHGTLLNFRLLCLTFFDPFTFNTLYTFFYPC